jgi:NADH-quinone oxidoreductase subunit B
VTLHSIPAPERKYRVAGHPDLRVAILDVGLACCALEVGAAITAGLLVPEGSGDTGPATSEVSVLLISGTVTDALAPAVVRAWGALAEPRLAVSFGACANTGGPYWDAPTVTKGIDQLIPISVYIPGCPPRPEALIAGLARLAATDGPCQSERGDESP